MCPLRGVAAEARTASESPSSLEVSMDGCWRGCRAQGEGRARLAESVFVLNSDQRRKRNRGWGVVNLCVWVRGRGGGSIGMSDDRGSDMAEDGDASKQNGNMTTEKRAGAEAEDVFVMWEQEGAAGNGKDVFKKEQQTLTIHTISFVFLLIVRKWEKK